MDPGNLVIFDFYCGAGGFTNGAISAGAHVACGFDCDPYAGDTFTNNENNLNPDLSEPLFIEDRIEGLHYSFLLNLMRPYKKNPVAFIGCPPCQPFTNLKTTKSRPKTDHTTLLTFLNLARKCKPDFIVIENVPGIRSEKYGTLWQEALNKLDRSGYKFKSGILNAKNYGVPQNRRRMVLIASRHGDPPWPKKKIGNAKYKTVKQTIGKLKPISAGETFKKDPIHRAAGLSLLNLERIKSTPPSGGSRKDWPPNLELECYKTHNGHTDVYGRMFWDKVSPALTTRFPSLSNGRFGHPEQHRAISLREGALLQSFPKKYKFSAPSFGRKAIHIGNAVPPKMAEAIIKSIIDHVS